MAQLRAQIERFLERGSRVRLRIFKGQPEEMPLDWKQALLQVHRASGAQLQDLVRRATRWARRAVTMAMRQ